MIHPEDLGPYQDEPSDAMIYLKDLYSYQGIPSHPNVNPDDFGLYQDLPSPFLVYAEDPEDLGPYQDLPSGARSMPRTYQDLPNHPMVHPQDLEPYHILSNHTMVYPQNIWPSRMVSLSTSRTYGTARTYPVMMWSAQRA